ncbi:hypothetical protein GCM10027347_29200 [Larkinella harenae]
MKKFEYRMLQVPVGGFWGGKIDNQELLDKLNELGSEGWEIASSLSTNRYEGQTHSAFIILKRELTESV